VAKSTPIKDPMPVERGPSISSDYTDGAVSSPFSTLGTKGVKPGPSGSNFKVDPSVESVWADLLGAPPEVRSGIEWPAAATDKNHN
jgi:hypothetical protein